MPKFWTIRWENLQWWLAYLDWAFFRVRKAKLLLGIGSCTSDALMLAEGALVAFLPQFVGATVGGLVAFCSDWAARGVRHWWGTTG